MCYSHAVGTCTVASADAAYCVPMWGHSSIRCYCVLMNALCWHTECPSQTTHVNISIGLQMPWVRQLVDMHLSDCCKLRTRVLARNVGTVSAASALAHVFVFTVS